MQHNVNEMRHVAVDTMAQDTRHGAVDTMAQDTATCLSATQDAPEHSHRCQLSRLAGNRQPQQITATASILAVLYTDQQRSMELTTSYVELHYIGIDKIIARNFMKMYWCVYDKV